VDQVEARTAQDRIADGGLGDVVRGPEQSGERRDVLEPDVGHEVDVVRGAIHTVRRTDHGVADEVGDGEALERRRDRAQGFEEFVAGTHARSPGRRGTAFDSSRP
jgi:hypothetical protein